ncbi:hypothetical protein [Paenisporosarcina sp. TG-14]|uniref:hypothetical protein n=1 Tax=Paenisporosarcina sp. TG-14 TaxID=1231057 RepID=UPI000379B474|nr:hypothetical protein [Paenisporosarcina sp. TG-14]
MSDKMQKYNEINEKCKNYRTPLIEVYWTIQINSEYDVNQTDSYIPIQIEE